jgi:tetratricopeptide (TPR) repeat protein
VVSRWHRPRRRQSCWIQNDRPDRPVEIHFTRDSFAAKVTPRIGKLEDGIRGLLEEGELTLGNVDDFLIDGELTMLPVVREHLTAAFAGKPHLLVEPLASVGAALHAARQFERASDNDGSTTTSVVHIPQPPAPAEPVAAVPPAPDPTASRGSAVEPSGGMAATPQTAATSSPAADTSELSLSRVHALLANDRRKEALEVLDLLIDQCLSLKDQLKPPPLTPARAFLEQAWSMLERGMYLDAVQMSHRAYDTDNNDPEVFSGMMRVHADAALRLDGPEDYSHAIKLLQCAHGHDQTDRMIHRALAERHFKHAVLLRNLNNENAALDTVNQALSFDPKHADARRLLEELTSEQEE